MNEYYVIEATLATGATKYLVVRVYDGVLVLFDKFDNREDALHKVEHLNGGS